MKNANLKGLLTFIVVLLIAAGVAWAGSQGGASASGIPIFAGAVGLAFLIQWVAFVPAYLQQNEKFFDLAGSLTYITVILMAVLLSPVIDGRSILLLVLVVIWAGRLGTFLVRRIHKAGRTPGSTRSSPPSSASSTPGRCRVCG